MFTSFDSHFSCNYQYKQPELIVRTQYLTSLHHTVTCFRGFIKNVMLHTSTL